jgi:uncharacterized protein (UPF0147 family)
MTKFSKVEQTMRMMLEDNTTPRTVRDKITNMIAYLGKPEQDDQRKIATVLSEIEDISSDVNIPPFVRTQLYSIASQLESLNTP